MARIKITLPDNYIFETALAVYIRDVNYGGHLGNDAVLSLVHEARMQFLAMLGYSEMNIEGYGLIIADAAINYKAQAFWQDKITIAIAVSDVHKYGYDMYYKLSHQNNNKDIAYVKTGIIIYDYEQQKIANLPQKFKDKLLQAKPL